jgi:hypothetical protein
MQYTADIDGSERVEKRMIDRLVATRIRQAPTGLLAALFDLKVFIFTRINTPIHFADAGFKLLFELGQMFSDRLFQKAQPDVVQQLVFETYANLDSFSMKITDVNKESVKMKLIVLLDKPEYDIEKKIRRKWLYTWVNYINKIKS